MENVGIESMFPYAPLLYHKGAKQNTIRVTRGTNAKLPHHKGFTLVYPMEMKRHFYITS
jgi:hypothetical protein